VDLRRELAYLLLRMDRRTEAEDQFRAIAEGDPDDMLAATQLGFLLYGRGAADEAMPFFNRVMAGPMTNWRTESAPCSVCLRCCIRGPNWSLLRSMPK